MRFTIRSAALAVSALLFAAAARAETIGVYMDNTVGGATTPFSGGTAAGTTNFSF